MDPDELGPFRVELRGELLATVGLATIGRPELTLRVETTERLEEAKALLVRIAAYVVSTTSRLEPGDVLCFEGGQVTLAADGGALRVTDGGPVEGVTVVRHRWRRRRW